MIKLNKSKCIRLISIGALVCVLFCSVLVLNFYDVIKPVTGVSAIPVCSVKSDVKQVALTFDCVSFGRETEKILQILKEFDIQGSFFVPGEKAMNNEILLLKLWAGGHDIGNMTQTYRDLGDAGTNMIKSEIQKCNASIEEITGRKCVLFRAPYDDYGTKVVKTAAAMGMYSIRYDVDALTWKPEAYKEGAIDRILDNVKPGSIIVFKADGQFTPEILREMINRLVMQGYQPMKVTDMILEDNFTVDVNGMQIQS